VTLVIFIYVLNFNKNCLVTGKSAMALSTHKIASENVIRCEKHAFLKYIFLIVCISLVFIFNFVRQKYAILCSSRLLRIDIHIALQRNYFRNI
jgi:hypothetical protein